MSENNALRYNRGMSFIVAVDIGGTQIRAAAYEPDSITPFAQKKNTYTRERTGCV